MTGGPFSSSACGRGRTSSSRNSAGSTTATPREALNGLDLYVERSALPAPEEDEFYHADLIGLTAETEAGEPLGTIVAVHDFGAGDLLDIAPPRGPSRLVPFTKAVVPVVDLAGGRVVVALPAEIDEEAPDETGETTG